MVNFVLFFLPSSKSRGLLATTMDMKLTRGIHSDPKSAIHSQLKSQFKYKDKCNI